MATRLANSIPHYADLGKPARFEDIPFLSKRDLAGRPEALIGESGDPRWYKETSGTTGPPVRIYYSPEFLFEQRFLDMPFALARAGAARLMRSASGGIFCAHLTDSSITRPELFVSPLYARQVYANLSLHDDRFTERIAGLAPRIYSSRPEILESLSASGLGSTRRPQLLVSAGGRMMAARRAAVEGGFGCRLVDAYTLSEFGVVASECRAGHLHVDETRVLVEIVDPAGNAVGSGGVGEITLSSVANSAQPLLRYRSGDAGALLPEHCGCGAAGRVLMLEDTRLVPIFHFGQGRSFLPTGFNDLPDRFPVNDYRIVQVAGDAVEVSVDVDPAEAGVGTLLANISCFVASRLPPGVSVAISAKRFDPLAKRQRYTVRETV